MLERAAHTYAIERTPTALTEVVVSSTWLVEICIRQLRGRHEPLDDLRQVARIGVLQAAERFDPRLGVAFRSYASAVISGVVRRHYRDNWAVHTPRSLQERHLDVRRAVDTLTVELQRSPTCADIARHTRLSTEQVVEALEISGNYWPSSIDNAQQESSAATIPATDEGVDRAIDRVELRNLLQRLPSRQRVILYLHYIEECTQVEIAALLDLTQATVSRLIASALTALRAEQLSSPCVSGRSLPGSAA